MSNLSGQQINQSFQGLLKLADSSTGITQSLQAVEDGLGNDTGLRIGTNYLGGAGLISAAEFTGMKGGTGIATGAGTAFNASSNGMLQSVLFYDRGNIPYSSITFAIGTVSSTQDTFDFAIYDGQFCDESGYQPKDALTPIITVTSADTVSTGLYTYNFSGLTLEKGGFYFLCFRVTNPGSVAPTFRFRNPNNPTTASQFAGTILGTVLDYAGTCYPNPFRAGTSQNIGQLYGGLNGVMQTSYTCVDFVTGVSSTNQSLGGFVLNPVI